MLKLANVHAYYGKSHVLHGVNFEVGDGEIVACWAATARAARPPSRPSWAWSTAPARSRWRDREMIGRKAFEIAHAGIGYVPENRDIFPTLTVHQNLMLGRKRGAEGRAGASTTCTGCSRG
jgi:branched-chain amino acid transport system ATP-binding protein